MPESPRSMLEQAYTGNFGIIPDLYAPTFLYNGVQLTSKAWQDIVVSFASAFQDLTYDLLDVTVEDDRVFNRYVMRATHTGDLRARGPVIPATGRTVELSGLEFRRVRDGRFVELWASDFFPELLQQLGAMPGHG